jgi:Xaa-Pro dipeptidase
VSMPASGDHVVGAHRPARVRAEPARRDVPAVFFFDPINNRYATGSRTMQVWTMHNACRYAFVAADGPVVLLDFTAAHHLAAGLETIGEVRPVVAWDFVAVGGHAMEMASSKRGWWSV